MVHNGYTMCMFPNLLIASRLSDTTYMMIISVITLLQPEMET